MTVRKRGRFYHYQFIVEGQYYYGALPTAKDKREARDQEGEIRRSVYDGTYGQQTGLNVFGQFVDSVFLKYSKENKLSYRHDVFRCRVLKDYFAGKTFKQITLMLVEKFIKERLSTETVRKQTLPDGNRVHTLRSPVTVHKEISLLSSIFNMAIQEKVTKENPCMHIRRGVRKRLKARNKRDRYLNQHASDEEKRLFEQFTGRREYLAAIVRFDLETGLRSSELRALKKEHVNLSGTPRHFNINDAEVIVWPNELLVIRSKNGKPRAIPLSPLARSTVEILCGDVTTGPYVFTSPKTGVQLNQIKKSFAASVRDAGLRNFVFHDLRHTFATRLKEAGVDPVTRRDLLGHSTIEMSADYTHTTPEDRREAISLLGSRRSEKERTEGDRGRIVATG